MNAERILYLNYFYPLDVVKSRRLPTRNIAGYNRAKRVTGALANAGYSVHIVSPGICAQCGWNSKLYQGVYATCEDGIDVTVAPAIIMPVVGALMEIVWFPLWTLLMLRRGRYRGAIFYNYSLSFVLLAILLRMMGLPFLSEIEDVAVPALSDWRPGSETRPIQQFVLWICMRAIVGLSRGVIVPSKRFEAFLPKGKPSLVVAGCVAESEFGDGRPIQLQKPIRVLFVGKYEVEHGVDLLIGTLKLLRSDESVGAHYIFDCCGTDNYPAQLQSLRVADGHPLIRFHGLLSDREYRSLLAEVTIALVLQKGGGRHANFKSPSKAYEFLAAGRLVLATDVGDFRSHDRKHLVMLRNESAEELVRVLAQIVESPAKYEEIAIAGREFSLKESSYTAVGKRLVDFVALAFGDRGPR